MVRKWCWLVAAALLVLSTPVLAAAQAKRLIIVKVDGLPFEMVDRFVAERDPRTGKSRLPWFSHLFYDRGTRLTNFYVRGLSLSAPSWSMLNTGQNLQIKENVEFDRFTLRCYDYLNFFPFYLSNALAQREDMPAVEVLDQLGIPLLIDQYPLAERYQGFQLYQRSVSWWTLGRAVKNQLTGQSPRELLGEWAMGFWMRTMLTDQQERELIQALGNPRVRYLDYYTSEFDHVTHHNRDRASHLAALQKLDGLIGRIWTAAERSDLARDTILVLVSDHGTNTDEKVYSQGFSLVSLLGSPEGGGHHVVTKRRPMTDYTINGVNPFIPMVITPSPDSYYLKGEHSDYPTAILDFDGNERASIHLRDSNLNLLHILFTELSRKELAPPLRRAASEAFFSTINRRRAEWESTVRALREELGALGRLIETERAAVQALPKEWTKEEREAGLDDNARRRRAQLELLVADQQRYKEFADTLGNLLALSSESFDPLKQNPGSIIPRRSAGFPNSIHNLQNYVVGVAPGGLVLTNEGALDVERSFRRINYLSLLRGVTVRNNVQAGVDNHPVDWLAVRVPRQSLASILSEGELPDEDAVWLYRSDDRQALILSRRDWAGQLFLRYYPVRNLTQAADGSIRFEQAEWDAGFPLSIWEDPNFAVPPERRAKWLGEWHSELEWLRAVHRTHYSNAIIGLHEQFSRHRLDRPNSSTDEELLWRFRQRQRVLVEADLLVLASNHWNFDVRGFNPGGNHGSFFRCSTRSTLMLVGGDRSGVPQALAIEEPYDSLSFLPSLLALTGSLQAGQPTPATWNQGARRFPGRLIRELFEAQRPAPAVTDGASSGNR